MNDQPKTYGEGRIRTNVSYADVERAAIAILKKERRPTVETIREALGSGSPETIGDALRRFWRDLGARIEGDPAALTRMPGEIAALADGLWQRALKLAGEAATHEDNAARERLRELELEVDIRRRSLELREQEIDAQARARERALADARDHLLSLSKALSREQATNDAQARRIADLEAEVVQYREQLGTLIAGVIANRDATPPRSRTTRAAPQPAVRRSQLPKPPKRTTRKAGKSKAGRGKRPRERATTRRARKQRERRQS
jgi:hypothetical protein